MTYELPPLQLAPATVPGNSTIHLASRFGDEDNWSINCGSSGTSGRRVVASPEGDLASINCGRCGRPKI